MLREMRRLPGTSLESENRPSDATTTVVKCALCRLEEHPCFRGRSGAIELEFRRGTIILRGRVPSFYLKQLLQEAMRDIDGVEVIDNRVDVVCSNGLSSTGGRDVGPG
jgi:hypothetical protein